MSHDPVNVQTVGQFVAESKGSSKTTMGTLNEITRALATGTRLNAFVDGASYPWLAPFAVPFEQRVRLALTAAVTNGPVPYDPRNIDQILESLTAILKLCRAHQNEAAQLEAAAVLHAIEYQLARLQRPAWRFDWWCFLLGLPNSEDAVLQAYRESLIARHVSPGGALNFAERMTRLLDHRLAPGLQEAYLKARAVQQGLQLVYGLDAAPLPAPDAPSLIDALTAWAAAVTDQVEKCRLSEVDFEHVIYIRDLIDDPRQYHSAMDPSGNGLLSFDLTNYFPPTLRRVRLRGLGASYAVNDDRQTGWWRLQQVSVIVFPPQAPDRPPVFLSAVSITDPSQPVRMAEPAALVNMDPSGTWQIKIGARVRFAHLDPHPRTEGNIRDVRLHLSLRARAASDAAEWIGFDW